MPTVMYPPRGLSGMCGCLAMNKKRLFFCCIFRDMKITCVWHNKGESKRNQLKKKKLIFFTYDSVSCNHPVKLFILFVSNRALKVSLEQNYQYIQVKNTKKIIIIIIIHSTSIAQCT